MRHLAFFLLSLTIFSSAALAQDQDRANNETSLLKICSQNALMVPLIQGTTGGMFGRDLPVLEQNQSTQAEFLGSEEMANQTLEICTSEFNLSLAIDPSLALGENASLKRACLINLNSTGSSAFELPGMDAGAYQIYALELNHTRVLSCSFVLVVARGLSTYAPSEISPGDILVIQVEMPGDIRETNATDIDVIADNASNVTNSSKPGELCYYGAMLVSEEDCQNTSIAFKNDAEGSPVSLIITRANATAELPTKFNKSSLNAIFPIMPSNSAMAMQESRDGRSELNLITDESLMPGRYVLFSAAYSARGMMMGVNQSSLVVKT